MVQFFLFSFFSFFSLYLPLLQSREYEIMIYLVDDNDWHLREDHVKVVSHKHLLLKKEETETQPLRYSQRTNLGRPLYILSSMNLNDRGKQIQVGGSVANFPIYSDADLSPFNLFPLGS